MTNKIDIRKGKVNKNVSSTKVKTNKVMLKREILENDVLILLIFKIKMKRIKRKIKLRALHAVIKSGAVWKSVGVRRVKIKYKAVKKSTI